MKKVLSVFLAVLMLFGALSVSSFAEETTAPVVTPPMAYHDWWGEGGPCSKEQAVLAFIGTHKCLQALTLDLSFSTS